jgi:hypothetical protein
MNNDEFYIGWMNKAPRTFASAARKYLLVMAAMFIGLGILLALSQKKFDTGHFEFGKLTKLKGIYFTSPIPCLKVIDGKNIWGKKNYITVPLIGDGKHGADGIIHDLQESQHISFEGREIELKGTLLYNDGKLLMQVGGCDSPFVKISNVNVDHADLPTVKNLGTMDLKGEIVDPKCFFGVMKPGEGKPHKDCAIRCILGGMPPVLKVEGNDGRLNYYLIVGPNGEKMNEAVKDYVGSPIILHAIATQHDDWIVLQVAGKDLRHYSFRPRAAEEYLSCIICEK